MKSLEWYKTRYPDDTPCTVEGRVVILPDWMAMYLLHYSGIKSKKIRHQKKAIKRAFNCAISCITQTTLK